MSNEIFKWQPQMMDITGSNTFNTAKVQFENDMVQRGLTSARDTLMFSFTYKHALGNAARTSKLANEIRTFWKARQGSYDNFWLPSWELEAKLDASYTCVSVIGIQIGTDVTVTPGDLGFSQASNDPGNYIYICQRFARGFEVTTTHEIARISSWEHDAGGRWELTLVATLDNSYTSIAYVQKAYKVFFDIDSLPYTMNIPDAVTYDINFKEDIASLYETDFGL